MKWGDNKRDFDTVLAVWPHYGALHERWYMQELVDEGDQPPRWRDRRIAGEQGYVFRDNYSDRDSAFAAARPLNVTYQEQLAERGGDLTLKRSLELKIMKALQSKERIQDEEALMLAEARRRHSAAPRPDPMALKLAPLAGPYREEIAQQLAEMPYLKIVRAGRADYLWNNYIFYQAHDGSWSKPYSAVERTALRAERAKIANGFGLSAEVHWGKTKARIRDILRPRANQLLQLASVRRLLDEAHARGQKVLISNGIVFWYEEDGGVGWQVKEISSTRESEGDAIWKEGTIRSINHGRLVVLPYIKENGETVRGHTKNGPNDGPALPRHPNQYVDIPFAMLEGDLMIGLMGELPYE